MIKLKYPKFVDANFDKETGISTAVLDTQFGICSGTAKMHPEDKEYGSSFLGCEIAEIRANIAYIKKAIANERVKVKTLENFYRDIEGMRDFDEKSFEAKKLRKTIYQYKKNIEDLKTLIQAGQKSIERKCKVRAEILEKITNGQKQAKDTE